MVDDEDESLAQVGHGIYELLDQITIFRTGVSTDSGILQALDLIINETDRFKIWSSGTGLLIPGHGSLDYRVREAESLSKTFRSFLLDLQENFKEVLSLSLHNTPVVQHETGIAENDSDDDSDDDDILKTLLESIKDIIDRLFRIATRLRSPESRLRSSRAQNFQILDDGVDLFKCYQKFDNDFVSSLFQHYRKGCKISNTDEQAASPDGSSKLSIDDGSSTYLIERIALANMVRRRQFAYWKHHRLKLEKHTQIALESRKVPKTIEVTGLLSTPIGLAPIVPTQAMTISTATQLPQQNQVLDDLVSLASLSEYMPSSAGEHSDAVIFPPPPQVAAESKFFECPYCFTTCAKKTSNVKAWQAHLIHDLRPYICTYKDCRTPNQLYDTRTDWIRHEITSHATAVKCPMHPDLNFDNMVEFRLHAADAHIPIAQVEQSARDTMATQSANVQGRSCPVCTASGLTTDRLNSHIAAHLERLAMFSLPKHTSMDRVDDDGRGSDEANGDEDSRGLDMESGLSFDSLPISVPDARDLVSTGSPLVGSKSQVQDYRSTTSKEVFLTGPESDGLEERGFVLNEEALDGRQRHLEQILEEEVVPEVDQSSTQESASKDKGMEYDRALSAAALINLATLQRKEGKLDEAERSYLQAIAEQQSLVEPDPISILNTITTLGDLYFDQGKLDQAEDVYQQATAESEKFFGSDYTLSFDAINNLGVVFWHQNELEKAEAAYTTSLATKERVLGPNHISTLDTVSNLSKLYHKKGETDKAERTYQRALDGKEEKLGLAHPSTLDTISSLGNLYYDQDRLDKAEEMYLRALGGKEKTFGSNHTSTLDTMSNLGNVYYDQSKLDKAKDMYTRALSDKRRRLGEHHASTLNTVHNLALLYHTEGMLDASLSALRTSEQLHMQALDGREKTLGPAHPSTLNTMNNLGNLYADQGNLDDAEKLYERALSGREKTFGLDHILTLDTVNDLGNLYVDWGRFEKAKQMYQRALKGYESQLGQAHQVTQIVRNELAKFNS